MLLSIFRGYSQDVAKDFYLKKSMKQDGYQYQFTVLEDDKRGVWFYSRDKFYFWYKAQRVLSTQGASSGQLLNGNFEAFYENKQLAQKGYFRKGLKDGKWMYWRNDGTLISIENWNKGSFSGTTEFFDAKGDGFETIRHRTLSTTRTTADSVIVNKNYRKVKVVYLKDENGKVIQKDVYKKGELQDKKPKKEKVEKEKKKNVNGEKDKKEKSKPEKPKVEKAKPEKGKEKKDPSTGSGQEEKRKMSSEKVKKKD